MKGDDLPPTGGRLIEASDQTGDDQAGVIHLLTQTDEVAIRLDLHSTGGESQHRLTLGVAERQTRQKAIEIPMQRRWAGNRHDRSPGRKAGGNGVSQSPKPEA